MVGTTKLNWFREGKIGSVDEELIREIAEQVAAEVYNDFGTLPFATLRQGVQYKVEQYYDKRLSGWHSQREHYEGILQDIWNQYQDMGREAQIDEEYGFFDEGGYLDIGHNSVEPILWRYGNGKFDKASYWTHEEWGKAEGLDLTEDFACRGRYDPEQQIVSAVAHPSIGIRVKEYVDKLVWKNFPEAVEVRWSR